MSRSKKLGEELMFTALKILKGNDNELSGNKVIQKIEENIILDDWAKKVYEKSGYTRWKSILHFYSIGCVKAGFLVKKKGVWYLTPEGEKALKLGKNGLFEKVHEHYKKWSKENKKEKKEEKNGDIKVEDSQELVFEEAENLAHKSLSDYIYSLDAYQFQDLCAALLRAMGYYTPFIAPKGKDGGVDVIAYRDPLGATTPRIKVQVKHRQNKATVQELRQLTGILNDKEVGIFISTGGFTSEAERDNRTANIHIELIDINKFIELWQEFYFKMDDEDKSLMPIIPVYFLGK